MSWLSKYKDEEWQTEQIKRNRADDKRNRGTNEKALYAPRNTHALLTFGNSHLFIFLQFFVLTFFSILPDRELLLSN